MDKDRQRPSLRSSLLQSMLVVIPFYALAAWNLSRGFQGPIDFRAPANQPISPVSAAGFILLFTVSHGVLPVFFYRLFFVAQIRMSRKVVPAFDPIGCFVTLHMTLWFGSPIILLSFMTGWWTLLWVVAHVVLAGHGRRRWTVLEYGSTAFALVMFLYFFRAENIYPAGVVVIVLQSLLLTLVDWKGRGLWITAERMA